VRDTFRKAPKPYPRIQAPLSPVSAGLLDDEVPGSFTLDLAGYEPADTGTVRAPMMLPEDQAALDELDRRSARRNFTVGLAEDTTPPETDAMIADAENRRLNAIAESARTPSQRTAHRMADELRYDPLFAAMSSGLDTATMGLDDEIVGAAMAATRDDLEYRDAQRALDESQALSSDANPWASRLGTLAGAVATLPIGEFAVPRAAGGGLTLANTARSAAPLTAASTLAGGVGGYLGADDGDELGATLGGAATGLGFGMAGAGLMGAGRSLASVPGALRTLPAAAMEGAGAGILSTPGMSQHTIAEPVGLAEDAIPSAALGAGMGTAFGAVGAGLSGLNRGRANVSRYIGSRGVPDIQPIRLPNQIDEGLMSLGRLDDAAANEPIGLFDEASASVVPEEDALEIARRIRAEREATPLPLRIFNDSIRVDPVTARLMQMGITGKRNLRQAENAFGSREGALAALNDIGLGLPMSMEPTRVAQQIADEQGIAAQRALGGIHADVAATGETIPGARLGRRISGIASGYRSGFESPRMNQIASALDDRAERFRRGVDTDGNLLPRRTPRHLMEDVEVLPPEGATLMRDPATGRMVRAGPTIERMRVTEIPEPVTIPYQRFRENIMAPQAVENRGTYTGSRTGPATPAEEAGLDVYRASATERDAAIQRALGPEGYARYMQHNRASRAAGLVTGADYESGQPANLRGTMAGIAEAATGGGVLGYVGGALRQRLIGERQHAILATLNEVGGANPRQIMQGAARLMQRLDAPMDAQTVWELNQLAQTGEGSADVFRRIAATSTDADVALNARRALALAENSERWPRILRWINEAASVDPAAAEDVAMAAEVAASMGTLGALEASLSRSAARNQAGSLLERESAESAPIGDEIPLSELEDERSHLGFEPIETSPDAGVYGDEINEDEIDDEREHLGF
jgi:hypothetical protein